MKYALVTGGSRGIGRAVAVSLAKMGYHVLINYHSRTDEALKTLEIITENGGTGEIMQFDVGSIDATEAVLGKWLDEHQDDYIEVLVNNAGHTKDNLLMWMTPEEWHSVINTNLNSFFYVTRLVLKGMLYKRYGRIINVTSLSGQKGLPGQANYSASKAGVVAATKSLAQEVGKKNVTVNCVAPGFIKTDMTAAINENDLKPLIPLSCISKIELYYRGSYLCKWWTLYLKRRDILDESCCYHWHGHLFMYWKKSNRS